MFRIFRSNQESRKISPPEKEADGFVFLGETANEKRTEPEGIPSFPEKGTTPTSTSQANMEASPWLSAADNSVACGRSQNVEGNPLMSDLLNDVPFTLAPHVLEMHHAYNSFPDKILTACINDNLSRFLYDFTLENSVLCEP
ncbi:UBAP1-MVB12-associated (UMA)-domain containing protein 1 [Pleurodeles waltl]|uniref:UBAP1-MVB12-associated (UMA)-domain containing protein 1 n=1 Tax=Pleurodeles waltl TaxID=8319 RepID=UPI003709620B